jgi:hypothetical protein
MPLLTTSSWNWRRFNAGDGSIPPKHHPMIDVQADADALAEGVVMMAGGQA